MKNSSNSIFFICLFIFSFSSNAQSIDAQQAYDSAQHLRSIAIKKWGSDGATKPKIAEGIQVLHNTLDFLQTDYINQLGNGNIYLEAKKKDVYVDIAKAYAIEGENDSAIYYLEKMFNDGSYSWSLSFNLQDSALKNLQSDSRFIVLVNKFRNQGKLYSGTAFRTPYRPELTDDEKIAGLSLLWSQAKYNFVYFDRLNIDWNQSYIDYLSKIKATKNTIEYYKVLQEFYAQLKDGHTNVYLPKELNNEFNSRPPLRTELLQGKIFVKVVFSDSLRKEGIVPGLEILKIDSQPVIEYGNKYIAPYLGSSTPQDMAIREYSYALLSGSADKPVLLELKDQKNKIFTKLVSRSGYKDIKIPPAVEYQSIGNIGYLSINNFEDWKIVKQVDSLFTLIAQTKALIIDIRNNGGGNSAIGVAILRKLSNVSFKPMNSKLLRYISEPGWEVNWYYESAQIVKPDEKLFYSKPVILLVGARTFSAAEDFAVVFRNLNRGKLIGQVTGGSTGEPVSFDLPGGGSARVCAKRETFQDGKEFVGIGIVPDIIINPTISDLQKNHDTVKDKALELLNSLH